MADNMFQWLDGFPTQVQHAADLSSDWDFFTINRPKAVAFLGIGGIAIGATLVLNLFQNQFTVPVAVIRGESPPSWLKEDTLAMAISYSGATQETITAFKKALENGAMGAVLSTGGRLTEIATSQHLPNLQIPAGYAPRAALGYTCLPLIFFLMKLGIISQDPIPIANLVKTLETVRFEWSDPAGPGAGVANRLLRRLPLVVGAGLCAPVAQRFQAQFAENSKVISILFDVPEALHNLVESLTPIAIDSFNPIAVFLEDPFASDTIKTHMRKIRIAMSECGVEGIPILAQGDSEIERTFSLIHKIDWISYHLAKMRGVDPVEIPVIKALKEK